MGHIITPAEIIKAQVWAWKHLNMQYFQMNLVSFEGTKGLYERLLPKK